VAARRGVVQVPPRMDGSLPVEVGCVGPLRGGARGKDPLTRGKDPLSEIRIIPARQAAWPTAEGKAARLLMIKIFFPVYFLFILCIQCTKRSATEE
jgi:hypothetical protein